LSLSRFAVLSRHAVDWWRQAMPRRRERPGGLLIWAAVDGG
jgi:hypothetical protein